MGGLYFLLALIFAASTSGGLTAFFFALISLNVVGGIIYRATGLQERNRRLRRPNPQEPRQVNAPRQRNRQRGRQWTWDDVAKWFENLENWDGSNWGERRNDPPAERERRATAVTDETDDRYVRREQPARSSSNNRSRPPLPASNRATRTTSTQRTTATPRPDGYPHAGEAMRRAGLDPAKAGLVLNDVGLIVYGPEPKPVVHRELAVPDVADYVQPFAELKAVRAAKGRLTFEVVDGSGAVVYRREEEQQLRAGKTAVIPRTRLPIGDHLDVSQGWTLRIYANDVLLAEHSFGWYNPADRTETLREVMANDGELTADLSALMDDIQAQPMSLDDLLGGDDSTSSQQQARR